jgi:hypothetical protein
MRKIVLTEKEPIKFFTLLTPDKVEATYEDVSHGVYVDCPGHCVAMVVIGPTGEKRIDIEPC